MVGRVCDEERASLSLPFFPERIRSDQLSAHLHREEESSASARRERPRGVDARIDEHSLVTASQGSVRWRQMVGSVGRRGSSQLPTSEAFRKVVHNQLTTHNAGHTTGLGATRTQGAAAAEGDDDGGA